MSTVHEMHVKEEYFDLLKAGKKLVEFRLNDGKRKIIKPSDKIRFFCHGDHSKDITLHVSDTLLSSDFSSLLQQVPLPLLGGVSTPEQLSYLGKVYEKGKEKKCGVIAILFGGK